MKREHRQETFASRRSVPAVPVEVTAEYAVGALLGVLTWWLDNDAPYPPDEMTAMLDRLAAPALAAGLGLRPRVQRP